MQTKSAIIELLPQHVIEKIAAGEVVERPASVLKELIENAIDARATSIEITIEDSGFSMLRISDNGTGMSPSDLPTSLLRHATSKIKTADDLFSIGTMGFRGEALASIAAVSRTKVSSATDNSGLGYSIESHGGVVSPVRPTAHIQGTTIVVQDLFFNVPARKKFMKSARGEQMALMRIIEQLVIPFPSIHFSVTVDGRKLLDFPEVLSLRERIAQASGIEFAKELIECQSSREGMDLLLYVSTPEKLQNRPRFQSLFVNLRRIDSDSVTYGIREAFARFLGAGHRPSFFCFLDIDPSSIDVNVHPTKQVIKFENEKKLFGFLYGTVQKSIEDHLTRQRQFDGNPGSVSTYGSLQNYSQSVGSEQVSFQEETSATAVYPQASVASDKFSLDADDSQQILLFPTNRTIPEKPKEVGATQGVAINPETEIPWELISCYQIHGLYILAPIKNGILLIDQHAAHERVLYEQALDDVKRGRSASQQLLFPIVLEVSIVEKEILESGKAYFGLFGFELSDFGKQAVSVSAIPAFMRDSQVQEAIRSMVRYLLEGKSPESFLDSEKRFAAAFACGAAIKAGQKLSQEEMNALLNSLFSTNNPYTCPHGRPTISRISVDEIARRFLR